MAVHRSMYKILSERNEAYPLAVVPTKPDPKEKPKPPTTKKKQPTAIPPQLYQYAVFTAPRQWPGRTPRTGHLQFEHAVRDPRAVDVRKHGVPVGPSFNLVVNRFRLSQAGTAAGPMRSSGAAATPARPP